MLIREIFPPSNRKKSRLRALLLLSGGLDSLLAGRVLEEQGVEIIGVTFESPFFSAVRAIKEARKMGWPLVVIDITEEEIEIVEKPKYGYGKNMNPCIDCHAQMVRLAGQLLDKYQARFIATGEVLGERPKSQNWKALEIVEKESGLKGLVLRPLSARLLPETEVEKRGWVKREKLLDIQGRSRKRQMELAEKFGLESYPTPSGGCLLTDPGFSARLKKLLHWRGWLKKEDIWLLKVGRHFFAEKYWIVVGRNEGENRLLQQWALPDDVRLTTISRKGPLVILRFKGERQSAALKEAALLAIRYSQARGDDRAIVSWESRGEREELLINKPEWEKYLTLEEKSASPTIPYRELSPPKNS